MMNYGSGRNKRRHAGKWSVKARSKGVGTPYLDRDAMRIVHGVADTQEFLAG
jgi:hypothetical protein